MSGGAFLILYIGLLIVATIVSIVGVRSARPEGRVLDHPDEETVAWLGGGRTRLFDMLAARRLTRGELGVNGRKGLAAADGTPLKWSHVTIGFEPQADQVEQRLTRTGLLADPDQLATMRRRAGLPFLILAGIGLVRLAYGLAIGRPVGFLFGLLLLTLTIWLIRGGNLDRRTRGGRATLARTRAAHERLRRAPMQPEMGMAVALFGTTVLAGSAYADFHRFRSANGDSGFTSDSGSDSGGSSDGGCGGGGCGGCGGGGD